MSSVPVLIPAHVLDDSWAVKRLGNRCFSVVGHEPVTPSYISHDLRPLSPAECAERGIRPSSADDHSTAILTGDSFALRRGLLRYHARKTIERC